MQAGIPAAVSEFRRAYRAQEISPRYSGVAHFLTTSLVSLAVIGVALAGLRRPSVVELLVVPATFVFANLVEYLGHKGPMHHLTRGLGLLFARHTLQHHRFYTHDAMSYEGTQDYKMVLFPPVMLAFFLGVVAMPLGLVLVATTTRNVALLYVASAMAYFLTYEWLHFCHHLPETSPLARVGVLSALRRHHQAHHDPALMQRHNFNITFPVCDALFGTRAPRSDGDTG